MNKTFDESMQRKRRTSEVMNDHLQSIYQLSLLSMNYFCSYGSPERFLQTGKRPWSYHFI